MGRPPWPSAWVALAPRVGGGPPPPPDREYEYSRERRAREGRGPTLAESLTAGDVVYGAEPVRAALSVGRRTPHVLFLMDGLDEGARKSGFSAAALTRAAEARGARVAAASRHDLNMLVGNRPHQGVALDATALDFVGLPSGETLPVPSPGMPAPVWVALDEVTDPQNLGAILRSAHFLGAAGVVVCGRNSAPLSAAVSKASAGAMEIMPVHSVRSLPSFLEACTSDGWDVVGADAGPGAVDAAEHAMGATPTILVLGSEGVGLRTTVRRACRRLLRIGRADTTAPGGAEAGVGDAGAFRVDSLNVSVAAAILLHGLLATSRPLLPDA